MKSLMVEEPTPKPLGQVPEGECFQLPGKPETTYMRLRAQAARRLRRTSQSPPIWAVSFKGFVQGFEEDLEVIEVEVYYAVGGQ